MNYADIVSGGESMTIVLRITGGYDSKIAAPFIIFKNKGFSYPIFGVPDDILDVSYRSSPNGWMSTEMFAKWLEEPRVIARDPLVVGKLFLWTMLLGTWRRPRRSNHWNVSILSYVFCLRILLINVNLWTLL